MKKRVGLATLLLLFHSASTTFAQGLLGTIAGTVTDSSGAIVVGATVTAKNPATNFAVTTATQGNGLYRLPNLQAGTYTVSISQPGFQTVVNSQILVQAERTATVNASLQIGGVSSEVVVSATPLRNEVDTTNGYILEEATIRATPLATGSFTQLAILSPAVNAAFLEGTGGNSGLGNQAIWANGQRDSSIGLIQQNTRRPTRASVGHAPRLLRGALKINCRRGL